jgi:RHS repeat-associated protein
MTVSRESNVVTPTSSMPKVQTQVREFSYCPTEPCSLAHYERARLHTEVVAPGDPIHESIRRFEYNDWGQPAVERSMQRSGQPGEVYTDELVISTTYDSAEHLFAVRVDNNLGHFTTRAFDWRFGRPVYEIDANGREQAWGYDLLQRNVYHLERGGLPPTGPFAGIWTTTQYERTLSGSGPSPFKVTVRSLDGSWSSKVFDTRGRLVSESAPVLDGSTRTKYYRYNFHGKVSHASLPTVGAASSSGAADATYAQSFYDRSGRLIKTIEPNGRTLLFDAQSTGRGMWKRTTEGGVRKSYSIYSAGGRLLASIDGVGNQRCFAYEPDGKVNATWVLKAGMGSGTPSLAACYSASNMFGAATVMVNDDYGHTSEINDPEAGRHEFRRDAAGRPVWEKDALGHESRLVYDALGRVTQKIIGSETTFQTWDEQMKGSLSSVSGPWGVVKKVHDNLGRVRAEVTRYTGDTEDVVFKYNYSPIHNKLESVDLPQPGTSPKFKFNYRYNSVGQLDAVLNTSKTWAYWRALGVDMLGNVSQEAYGVDPFDSGWAHSWTTRNYVPLTGALTRLTAYGYNAGYIDLLQDFVVMRQQNNQVWRRVDALMGQGEIYTYDNADRLRRAEVEHWAGNLVTDYNYDPLGNLTTKSDIGTMAYGMQYANPRALTRAGSVYYSYDANGNVIERGPLGAKDSYAWDEGNRLSEIASSDGVNLSFDYNSDGQRIRRTSTDGSQWSYYGVYSREKRRASQGGGIEHHYRVTLGGRTLCELTFVPGGTYTFDFIHEDERNSPNVITRSGVGIIERMAFDVYGRKRDPANWANRNGTFFNDSNATVGFTGHAELQDDSLTWMGSRHFDSYAGRFIKPDTIVADPSSTQGWARYTYVENDPVNFTDPSGHQRYDPDRPVYSWWGEVYEQAMFWGVGAGTLAAMWNVTMPSSEFWDESKMQQNTALGSGESSGTWTVVHQIIHVVQAPPEGAPVVASDGTRSNGFGVTIVVHYSHSHSVVAGVSLHAGDDPTKIDVNDATLHDFDHETMPGAKSEFNSSDVLLGSSPFIIVMLAEVAAYLAGGGTVATLLGLQEGSAAGTGGASAGVASDAAASAPTLVAAAKAIPRVGQTAKNITEVTISSLRALHAVPRPGMPANHIQNLAQSIRTNGYDLNQAISVMRLPSGQLVSAGGHHRVAAMQSLGETTIPARVVDWSSMSTGAQQWYLNNFPSLGELLQ